jgi:hypothetical protein
MTSTGTGSQQGQRRDERRHLAVGDQEAVDQPDRYADGDGEQHGEHHRHPLGGGAPGQHGRRQGRHRADRQVDARGDDHEGDAEGENGGHGRLHAHVQQVVRRQEVAGQRRQGDDEDDERGERPVVEQQTEQAAGGATRARPALERVSGHGRPPFPLRGC